MKKRDSVLIVVLVLFSVIFLLNLIGESQDSKNSKEDFVSIEEREERNLIEDKIANPSNEGITEQEGSGDSIKKETHAEEDIFEINFKPFEQVFGSPLPSGPEVSDNPPPAP